MSFWEEVANQADAVAQLEEVTRDGVNAHHAWMIIGPPGSGRITLARRFAAALVAQSQSEEDREQAFNLVQAGTHPDVLLVSTSANQLDVQAMRDAVRTAYFAPTTARRRVIVVEDADRMNIQAANAALKALEEPPETTVWILCAPSVSDVLPTIASRTRVLRLRMPTTAEVAELLITRHGISAADAEKAARHAQNHIGMANRLALSEVARERREVTVLEPLKISGLAHAMHVARQLTALAEEDAETLLEQQGVEERDELRRRLGLAEGEKVPANLNSHFRALDDDLKRRKSRALRDGMDRILVDLLSVARDILIIKIDGQQSLINAEYKAELQKYADNLSEKDAVALIDTYEKARIRLFQNVNNALILEAVFAKQFADRQR